MDGWTDGEWSRGAGDTYFIYKYKEREGVNGMGNKWKGAISTAAAV